MQTATRSHLGARIQPKQFDALGGGGNEVVTISGGSGTYSVSGNSNTSVASASLSGNALTAYALASGSATITVCDQSGNCGPLYITVNSASGGSQSVVFSTTNPTIAMGQNFTVSLSGGSNDYVSSNANG